MRRKTEKINVGAGLLDVGSFKVYFFTLKFCEIKDAVYLRSKVLGLAGLWLWDRSPLFQVREKFRASI